MTENAFTSHTGPQAEPTLRRNLELPKGVLQKSLKTFVYYRALKPRLSGAASLEFDQRQELTTFQQGYFWEKNHG